MEKENRKPFVLGDVQAIGGYVMVERNSVVLYKWRDYIKEDNSCLHVGTNFDLSNKIDTIDMNKQLCILYDFMHRIMLYYYDNDKYFDCKILNAKEFDDLITEKEKFIKI